MPVWRQKSKMIVMSMSGDLLKFDVLQREGFSKFNKIYEFECLVRGQQRKMIMTSVSGHLLNFEFEGNYKKWYSCRPIDLFEAPVRKLCPPDYEPIKRTLEREIRSCNTLIIWTDCDREGENIGYEIISVCTAIKPNLQIFRAQFSEITAQSARRAIQNLGRPNELISKAVDVRSELDLRIGAAFTRFQTLRLQRVFPETLASNIISYGSCQFPTLGFVVERYKAIESFIPEQFWKIKVSHDVDEVKVDFAWSRVRLFDESVCRALYERCLENPSATVESVTSKPKSKWRPLPLDTVEFEKLASRKLRLNAKIAMATAEKLYTKGFISYPRTETNIFPKELNLVPLVEMQTENRHWGDFARRVLNEGPNPRQGKKSDQAHPPIHPTKAAHDLEGTLKFAASDLRWVFTASRSTSSVWKLCPPRIFFSSGRRSLGAKSDYTPDGNEAKVYEFVVRHFLACVSKDAQGHETIVQIDINGEKFVGSGLMILARNYLDVYPYETWSDRQMHVYQQGQVFQPTTLDMTDGETAPPKLLTEADLIALMEKHGIGTDATHAEHIEKIKSRQYVGLENNIYFVPGHLGIGLVDGYDSMGFNMSKPHLRAELEADLVRISNGEKDAQIVLAEQIVKYKEVFQLAMEQAEKIDTALAQYFNIRPVAVAADEVVVNIPQSVTKCQRCRCNIVVKQRQPNGSFYLSCQGYPQCRCVLWLPSSIVGLEIADSTCPECGPDVKQLKITFQPGAMGQYYPTQHVGCLHGCDTRLLEMLGIQSIPSVFQERSTQQEQSNTPVSSSGYSSLSSNARSSSSFVSNQPQRNVFNNNLPQRPSTNARSQFQNSFVDNNSDDEYNRGMTNRGTNNANNNQRTTNNRQSWTMEPNVNNNDSASLTKNVLPLERSGARLTEREQGKAKKEHNITAGYHREIMSSGRKTLVARHDTGVRTRPKNHGKGGHWSWSS
ncbi:DNA topoisomerase 3-alpha [Homalodisca vitripennis]|nr:DNA topoisomerase 3-alpha [Homalodisca vitripennis]